MKGFNATTQEECVLIAFLVEKLGLGHPLTLIVHVADNQLVWCVLEPIQLWQCLVTGDICSREVHRLFDVPVNVLVILAQIQQ